MMRYLCLPAMVFISASAAADTLPFELSITGKNFQVSEPLELSDVGEGKTRIGLDFRDKSGKPFRFDLNYKALPENRSYPTNLDITVSDGAGEKLGYLFFANNGVQFLKRMGVFGLVIVVDGEPVDVRFTFDGDRTGKLRVADLDDERFVQDTLVSKYGFQMIRPVVLPRTGSGMRAKTYRLDAHPFAVNYALLDQDDGLVQFQHNLYRLDDNGQHLLARVYYNSDSLETLREAMFAAKYFDKEAGAIKLVFYPAMGQTEPAR
ncbi:MAG: hypothetical protein U9R74_20510 [Pseudomonadota bacterium]|nr:hypothetical protein [Pseudomonadota bacterium]